MNITKDIAVKLAESKFYEKLSAKEIATFQLNNNLLCMPFSIFHKAVEEALGRPVWTHEFAYPEMLLDELYNNKPKPTMEEILNMISESKQIIILEAK